MFISLSRRRKRRYILKILIFSLIIGGCSYLSQPKAPPVVNSSENKTLTIWWDKGSNIEEDDALIKLIKDWEKTSGNQAKLAFYSNDKLPERTRRAIQAGNVPDIVMSSSAERELIPHLAWEGKLADVSDVIEPVKNNYSEAALEAVYFYNKSARKRSYYAVPINQLTIHIHYWRDMLKQVGSRESDIPTDWDGFWKFWQQVQDDLKALNPPQDKKELIYGLGLPFSVAAADTYYTFEQILEAYNVEIVNSQGVLRLDEPSVRQGIIKSLTWYANLYQQGYVPPNATQWLNPDNNRNLINRKVVMTANTTLSIPAAVRQNPDLYRNKVGTLEFPKKPNGEPMRYLVAVNAAILFTNSNNQKEAKDFLTYLIQPETIKTYIKSAGGRYLPVMTPLWQDSFWTNPADPHLSIASKVLMKGQTRPFYFVQNPAYSLVLQENIWGKAIARIVKDSASPQQAASEAIAQIKEIFAKWERSGNDN
ncbi:ABC transporter substrate-binding protein [Scytonema hofmannii PCC 7110]|uniref:ABC transporter substrate-binding protein n=1 Tax=Scytonema hofmannii PCC 7110 TaxID=128403 RepID=A0A139XFA9_9CYAN|nr:ABC transporter substrate-binding protein [Scytonema hofmannii]KYC43377.1 ABC transporter substrate-binding protein [Scytonema hofmannii PCC 7110]